MFDTPLVMRDEDCKNVLTVIQRLVRDANAKGIFIVDKTGQLVSEAGEMDSVDSTSLASLTAGCIAATNASATACAAAKRFFIGAPASTTMSHAVPTPAFANGVTDSTCAGESVLGATSTSNVIDSAFTTIAL